LLLIGVTLKKKTCAQSSHGKSNNVKNHNSPLSFDYNPDN
jgi:hypothetical protein